MIDSQRISGTQEFSFELDGEVVYEALPEIRPLSDGIGLWISVPIPKTLDLAGVKIEREVAGQVLSVDPPADKRLHELRLQAALASDEP